MLIDSADLIRKLPMMIQCNKTFAKFSEGGDYHIGEVDSWCLNYKEIVEGIESYCSCILFVSHRSPFIFNKESEVWNEIDKCR